MKRTTAIVLALFMALSLCMPLAALAVPALDAGSLDEALNIPGGGLVFTTSESYPWIVDGDAARSGNSGVHSSSSTVWTTATAAEGDYLQFDFLSMGEGRDDAEFGDFFMLYIDGAVAAKWGAHTEWESYAVALSAGEHVIEFVYQKDGSVNPTGDCVFVDNVSVGEPVLPNSIVVEAMSLPLERRAYLSFEVLPANTADHDVTFSIEDEAIARVDENGLVTALSLGETTVTVTSVLDTSVSGTATITVTEAVPTVRLRGYVRHDMALSGMTKHWVGFEDYDPTIVDDFGETPKYCSAGAYLNGYVYGYLYDTDTSSSNPVTNYFIMNAETHEMTYPGATYPNGIFAMAYDETRNTMFALVGHADIDGEPDTRRSLGRVDLATGEVEIIAPLTGADMIMTLAIDGEGNGYALTLSLDSSTLLSVDLDTGACTPIGGTGVGLMYQQSMVYDHESGMIYWAQTRNSDVHGLYVIDPATAQATRLGTIGNGLEINCLYIERDIEIEALPGDTNLDGSVAVEDAVLALRAAMGIVELTGQAAVNGDMNGDGSIAVEDAIAILRRALGL